MLIRSHRKRRGQAFSPRFRRGAAVVEMAVVAPLLLTLLFGVMEFGWSFMVHETITNTARECCRLATLQGTTDGDVQARFVQAMAGTGVDVTADMIGITRSGDVNNPIVTVNIAVPYSEVSITGLTSFLGITTQNLKASCSMRAESTF
ncbi:MAG: pilus assembly protein [Phycisphaerae bacterium]|nr:pilus assembly protein [Phycisphaerae bacterium]